MSRLVWNSKKLYTFLMSFILFYFEWLGHVELCLFVVYTLSSMEIFPHKKCYLCYSKGKILSWIIKHFQSNLLYFCPWLISSDPKPLSLFPHFPPHPCLSGEIPVGSTLLPFFHGLSLALSLCCHWLLRHNRVWPPVTSAASCPFRFKIFIKWGDSFRSLKRRQK